MVEMLGGTSSRFALHFKRPNSVMIVGLQGSGKTTSTGKLSKWLVANQGRNPLLLSVDVYRPAARDQLAVIGKAIGIPVFEGAGLERSAGDVSRGAAALRAGRLRHADD
jgi:signal recognition particle subunit SRP54